MLINGKNLSQIKKEIMAPENKAGNKQGKPYYKYWQFKKRLDAVFGLNYCTEYTQVQTISCGKQVLISCVCTITILEDDGLRPVIKRSGVGGREFAAYQEGDGYANFQSTPGFAERAAFCEACKDFGMFGSYDEDSFNENQGNNIKGSAKGIPDSNNYKKGTFVTHSVMTCVEKGNGEVTYFLNVVEDGEEKSIIFYPNQYKKVEQQFRQIEEYLKNANLVKGVRLEILYSEGSQGGIIFKGFPQKEG